MTSAAAVADRPDSDGASERLSRAIFALLVLACFVAFFLTQHLKHTPTVVQTFRLTPDFSPTPAGNIKEEKISFKLARADEVTVQIVQPSGALVATLLHDYAVARYKALSLRWNGRRGTALSYALVAGPNGRPALAPRLTGAPAPPGEYRVRVRLRAQRRTVFSPRNFKLVRE